MEGLEPPRLAAPDPKSGTATNYATCAFFLTLFLEFAAKPQKSLICNQKGSANLEIIRYD
jgi:hypothetical protein